MSDVAIEQPAFLDWPWALMSQLGVDTDPENNAAALDEPVLGEVSAIEHPGPVCRVMALCCCVLTPSIMSISPEDGQSGPTVQNAGQTPQAWPGMCSRSRMIKAWLYIALEVKRTDFRPRPEATFVASTPM